MHLGKNLFQHVPTVQKQSYLIGFVRAVDTITGGLW